MLSNIQAFNDVCVFFFGAEPDFNRLSFVLSIVSVFLSLFALSPSEQKSYRTNPQMVRLVDITIVGFKFHKTFKIGDNKNCLSFK